MAAAGSRGESKRDRRGPRIESTRLWPHYNNLRWRDGAGRPRPDRCRAARLGEAFSGIPAGNAVSSRQAAHGKMGRWMLFSASPAVGRGQ